VTGGLSAPAGNTGRRFDSADAFAAWLSAQPPAVRELPRYLACGSRDWPDTPLATSVVAERFTFLPRGIVLHGDCRGADRAAARAAEQHDHITCAFGADWARGRQAGLDRNLAMLACDPALAIAFTTRVGGTAGTRHTLRHAYRRGIPLELWAPTGDADFHRLPRRPRAPADWTLDAQVARRERLLPQGVSS